MTRPFFRRVLSFTRTYEPVLAFNWRLSYIGGLAVQDRSMGVNICRLSVETGSSEALDKCLLHCVDGNLL